MAEWKTNTHTKQTQIKNKQTPPACSQGNAGNSKWNLWLFHPKAKQVLTYLSQVLWNVIWECRKGKVTILHILQDCD